MTDNTTLKAGRQSGKSSMTFNQAGMAMEAALAGSNRPTTFASVAEDYGLETPEELEQLFKLVDKIHAAPTAKSRNIAALALVKWWDNS